MNFAVRLSHDEDTRKDKAQWKLYFSVQHYTEKWETQPSAVFSCEVTRAKQKNYSAIINTR